jgi:hypothetical protein
MRVRTYPFMAPPREDARGGVGSPWPGGPFELGERGDHDAGATLVRKEATRRP